MDPTKEVPVCRMPAELTTGASRVRYFTHLTLTKDRKYAYLDSRVDDNHVQGLLELATGKYEKWGETGLVNINHGQINPIRNDIALNAWECVKWKDSKGVEHGIEMDGGRHGAAAGRTAGAEHLLSRDSRRLSEDDGCLAQIPARRWTLGIAGERTGELG